MENLLRDIRYAVRLLRKSPGFSAAAVLTLALGMSASTVMFSVLNTVLFRPLPYPQANRLVQIWETDSRLGEKHGVVSPHNFVDWQSQSRTFEQMATYDYNSVVLTGRPISERLAVSFVSAGFFDVLKVPPLKGRTFLPGEDQPGKPRAAVLSYGAWLRYFGGDPEIAGRSILLDDQAYAVVGVMPSGFAFPGEGTDVWCLPGFDLKQTGRNSGFLQSIGRIQAGSSFQQAQEEMSVIAARLSETWRRPGRSVRLVPLQEEIVGGARRGLLVMWAAVLVVLLIACANVAGLLLARAVSRQKEVAIRRALGGSRSRLVRQFLTESVLLAIAGGIVGVALSFLAGRFLISAGHGAIPRLRGLQIDGFVLTFAAVTCIVTGLAFGLAPALSALRVDLSDSLKQIGPATQITGRLRLRSLFAVVEIGLAMVLLVGGGLLIKTLWRLQHVDAGFQAENVLTFRFAVPKAAYTSAQKAELYGRISERLAALPGVDAVGATNDLPFAGSRTSSSFEIEGRPADPTVALQADYRTVSPGYFPAMRLRFVQGRQFSPQDNREAPPVAIVNQALVKKFFSGEDPVLRRIRSHEKLYEIVGVIADVKHESLGAPGIPELYVCNLQADLQSWAFFVVRSRMDVNSLSATVRGAVKEVAPDKPLYRMRTMTDLVEIWMAPRKFSRLLLSVFAGLALVLASIGIYGVIAYSVVQRTREIGIRIALGADRPDVLRLILRQGLRLAIMGLSLGAVAAGLTTRALSSMLFGVNPLDPSVFFVVSLSLLVVVVFAVYIPARKAARVDPLAALRHE